MASRPRVKTGCGICRYVFYEERQLSDTESFLTRNHRKRRIKCDEARPACGRCLRSGWKCDGYPGPNTAAPGSQSFLRISAYSIPFRIPGSKKDRQVLHYFCVQGADDISGFMSSPFWSTMVLQISHQEPAVRQILIALSSLHLDYISSTASGPQVATTTTIRQYGKGLKMLRNRLEASSPESILIALVASILFYCFESIMGNRTSALQQLRKGMSLIPVTKCTNQVGLADTEEVLDLFARLDVQSILFDDGHPPTLNLTTPEERLCGFIERPEVPFATIKVAQKVLVKLQNWLSHFLIKNVPYKFTSIERIESEVRREKNKLDEQFLRWYQKLEGLMSDGPPTSSGSNCETSVLLIQYHIWHMVLAANFPNDHKVFGACPNLRAGEVVTMAEEVLQMTRNRNKAATTAQNPRRNFSSEIGFVAPLAILVIKCADASVVERGMRVLAHSQRQEGLYDGVALTSIAQYLEQIKASKLQNCGDVVDVPRSLEYWTMQMDNGEPACMTADDKLIPPTILRSW